MNIKRLLLLLISLCCFCGCKTIPLSDFHQDLQNPSLLSRMWIWVDITSVEKAYHANSWSADGKVKPDSPYGKGVLKVDARSQIYTAEKRVQDAVTIFVNDITNNVMDVAKARRGNIVLRINHGQTKNNYKWSYASGITLGIGNAFGMPLCSSRVDLDVQVEIYDRQNNLVAKYNELGTAKDYMAPYWGFYEFRRRTAIFALQDGLAKIKENIIRDYSLIEARMR